MDQQAYAFNVSEHDFQERVMLRSQQVPVLVDFWAEWCGPCKTLGPLLERLAEEFGGAFELAKVDVDANQQLAAMFRIQSIPTCFLFVGGQPVDGFQGAQTESAVRALLERAGIVADFDPLELATSALNAGDAAAAEQLYLEILADNPMDGPALLGLARAQLNLGRTDDATATLERIGPNEPEREAAERLKGVIGFSADAGDLAALLKLTEAEPRNPAGWYGLGATYATRGEFEAGYEAFLKVVTLDRGFREDAGRRALLSLFDLSDPEDPTVIAYRRRLASLLF